MRKPPIGSGSDLRHLMKLPRTELLVKPEDIFGELPVLVVGGVATRAYAPERHTKDIDFLVEDERFHEAAQSLSKNGFRKGHDLYFPNTSLGLYGEAWSRGHEELDIISTPQEWCHAAFLGRAEDATGLRVIPLPYLILMKFDSARGIDQGDLTRMLGRLDDAEIERLIATVENCCGDPAFAGDIRQYAQLGRWEWETERQRR